MFERRFVQALHVLFSALLGRVRADLVLERWCHTEAAQSPRTASLRSPTPSVKSARELIACVGYAYFTRSLPIEAEAGRADAHRGCAPSWEECAALNFKLADTLIIPDCAPLCRLVHFPPSLNYTPPHASSVSSHPFHASYIPSMESTFRGNHSTEPLNHRSPTLIRSQQVGWSN